jgi:hypothetical protein
MTGDLLYIPDWPQRLLDRWLAQFRTKPVMRSLMRAIGRAVQCQEDDAFSVSVSTRFPEATGDALDQWGATVGEPRGNFGDATYRLFIRARIKANNSNGSADDLIEAAQLVTAPSTVRHQNIYPACTKLEILRETPMDEEHLRRTGDLLRGMKAGGVCLRLVEAIPGYYGFVEDPNSLGLDAGCLSRIF